MVLLSLSGVEPGNWSVLEAEEAAEEGASIAVPLERLGDESEEFFNAVGSVGAVLSTDTDYSDLAPLANKLSFVAIDFPAFTDGRGFSLAVRLRKDLGFKGEIRATGHVIPDQAQFLMRAGFDTVDAPDERSEAFENALVRFKEFYQTDFLGTESVAHARHNAASKRTAS